MRILVKVHTNKVGSECADEFDLPDDLRPSEVENEAMEAAYSMVDWDYEVIE